MPPPSAPPQQPPVRPRWLEVASAIAYELKPFSLPTRHDLIHTYQSTRVTLQTLWEDACRGYKTLQPVVVESIKKVTLRQAALGAAWGGAFLLFVYLEFGVVFLIVSTMCALYMTTGDTRGQGMSAWSVFNEGFRPLLGTLDADQIDRAIRHQGELPMEEEEEEEEDDDDDGQWEMVHHEGKEDEAKAGSEEKKRGSRKSGKKARRAYNKEERLRKREEHLARHDMMMGGEVGDGWESD